MERRVGASWGSQSGGPSVRDLDIERAEKFMPPLSAVGTFHILGNFAKFFATQLYFLPRATHSHNHALQRHGGCGLHEHIALTFRLDRALAGGALQGFGVRRCGGRHRGRNVLYQIRRDSSSWSLVENFGRRVLLLGAPGATRRGKASVGAIRRAHERAGGDGKRG